MLINVKLKDTGVAKPKTGTPKSSGYDIIAISDPIIEGIKIDSYDSRGYSYSYYQQIDYIEYKTNIFLTAEDFRSHEFHTLIHPRSSICKKALILANSIGLCDKDYTGEYICRFKYLPDPRDYIIRNDNIVGIIVNSDRIYKKNDKICQLKFEEKHEAYFQLVKELDDTERSSGGFGSTGQ